jgi:hypothetical protein
MNKSICYRHCFIFDIQRYKETGVITEKCKNCGKSLRELFLSGDENIIKAIRKVDYTEMNLFRRRGK